MDNKMTVFKEGYHKLLQSLEQRWQRQDKSMADINEFVEQGMQAYRYASDINSEQLQEIEQQLKVDLTAFIDSIEQSPEGYSDSPQFLAIEGTLWQWLWLISDNSQIEWQGLADDFSHQGVYHSGEVVGLGKLECQQCQHSMSFYHPVLLSSCPQCDHQDFKRVSL